MAIGEEEPPEFNDIEPKEWEDDNVDVYEMQTESEIQTDNQYMDGEADTSLR